MRLFTGQLGSEVVWRALTNFDSMRQFESRSAGEALVGVGVEGRSDVSISVSVVSKCVSISESGKWLAGNHLPLATAIALALTSQELAVNVTVEG